MKRMNTPTTSSSTVPFQSSSSTSSSSTTSTSTSTSNPNSQQLYSSFNYSSTSSSSNANQPSKEQQGNIYASSNSLLFPPLSSQQTAGAGAVVSQSGSSSQYLNINELIQSDNKIINKYLTLLNNNIILINLLDIESQQTTNSGSGAAGSGTGGNTSSSGAGGAGNYQNYINEYINDYSNYAIHFKKVINISIFPFSVIRKSYDELYDLFIDIPPNIIPENLLKRIEKLNWVIINKKYLQVIMEIIQDENKQANAAGTSQNSPTQSPSSTTKAAGSNPSSAANHGSYSSFSDLPNFLDSGQKVKLKHSIMFQGHQMSDFYTKIVFESLFLIIIDPYYRTLSGFLILLQSQWFSHDLFGKNKNTNEILKLQLPFLQFLDILYFFLLCFPRSFEFTFEFLIFLLDSLQCGSIYLRLFNYYHLLFNSNLINPFLIQPNPLTSPTFSPSPFPTPATDPSSSPSANFQKEKQENRNRKSLKLSLTSHSNSKYNSHIFQSYFLSTCLYYPISSNFSFDKNIIQKEIKKMNKNAEPEWLKYIKKRNKKSFRWEFSRNSLSILDEEKHSGNQREMDSLLGLDYPTGLEHGDDADSGDVFMVHHPSINFNKINNIWTIIAIFHHEFLNSLYIENKNILLIPQKLSSQTNTFFPYFLRYAFSKRFLLLFFFPFYSFTPPPPSSLLFPYLLASTLLPCSSLLILLPYPPLPLPPYSPLILNSPACFPPPFASTRKFSSLPFQSYSILLLLYVSTASYSIFIRLCSI